VSSLTNFGSAGGEALQGHSKVLPILHRGAKRAILTRVKGSTEGVGYSSTPYKVDSCAMYVL